MACAEDLTGIRLVKMYLERAIAEGKKDKSQLEFWAPNLCFSVRTACLAHVLAMVNYEGMSLVRSRLGSPYLGILCAHWY
jgi:hypothetical protein